MAMGGASGQATYRGGWSPPCDAELRREIERRRRAWTAEAVGALRVEAYSYRRERGFDLHALAEAAGLTVGEANRALDAMLGRSDADAARALNAMPAGGWPAP